MEKKEIIEFFKGNHELDPFLRERIKHNYISTGTAFKNDNLTDEDLTFINNYKDAWSHMLGRLKSHLDSHEDEYIEKNKELVLSGWILQILVKGFSSVPEISSPLYKFTSELLQANGLFFNTESEKSAWIQSGKYKDVSKQFNKLISHSESLYDSVGKKEIESITKLLSQIKLHPSLNTYQSSTASYFRLLFSETLDSKAHQFIFDYSEVKTLLETMPGVVENILSPRYLKALSAGEHAVDSAERKKLIREYITSDSISFNSDFNLVK